MLYDLLRQQAQRWPDQPAVIGERRRLTYAEFFREVNDGAAYLAALGLSAGDAIVIGIPPSPEFHVVFYAACALGLLILPVLPSGKIPEVVRKAKPLAAVGAESFLCVVTARCEGLAHRIEYGPHAAFRFPANSQDSTNRRVFREQPILGVSSSGTTGEPSIYLRSAQQIHDRAELRASLHNFQPEDILFSTRPYNSGSAINNHVITPVFVGCGIVVQERFERLKAAEAISRERITVLWAVPFFFEMLATIPPERRLDFSSVRMCVSGSAALAPAVSKQFEDRYGLVIRQRYGGSQIHPAFLVNLDGPRDSVGRVDGVFPVAILGENGQKLEPQNIGEIAFDVAKTPALWRKTLETNPNFKDGYLRSGDLGRADDYGNVYVVGRKSPFIKVGANRVEPAEVENLLRRHPQVSEALVFGAHVGDTDETVQAEVIALGPVTERELLSFCAQHLDAYKCPRRIAIKTDLPRNVHGKIIRSASKTES